MPAESHFDVSRQRIYLRYWGRLTLEEFLQSLEQEPAFFAAMRGMVGIIIDAQELQTLPFGIVTTARTRPLAHYKPLIIGMISQNVLAWSLARIFSAVTGVQFERFTSVEEAEAFFRETIGIP
jgi:hypothetical protein